jgi:hypothetical protein
MKRITFMLMALAILATGCQKGREFTVTGDLASVGLPDFADSLAIMSEMIDAPFTAAVKNDAFQFEGKVKKPAFAKLTIPGWEDRFSKPFILEEGNIVFQDGYASGTPLNDAINQFYGRIPEILRENRQDPEAGFKALEDTFFSFVAQHKNDPCATLAILKSVTLLPADSVVRLIESASPKIQEDENVRAWKAKMQKAK